MKQILTLLLAALGLNTACSQNFDNYDVAEFAELIADSNVVILDVRKADEFVEGHIKGAILLDQFQSDFVEQAQAKLPKDKTIAIYCRSGRRSANAAGKLADIGYKCVNLKGGILAWKEANMPVIKEMIDLPRAETPDSVAQAMDGFFKQAASDSMDIHSVLMVPVVSTLSSCPTRTLSSPSLPTTVICRANSTLYGSASCLYCN